MDYSFYRDLKSGASGGSAALQGRLRRLFCLFICFCVAICSLPYIPALSDIFSIYGQTKVVKTLAGTISGSYSLDMWHYSGGYWKVGNSWASAIRFNDSEIDGSISNALVGTSADFTSTISSELAAVLSGTPGKDYELEWGKSYEDYYDEYTGTAFPSGLLSVSGTTATIRLTPRFNLSGDTIADLSGISTSKTIPVVADKYGCNIYSVFGNGASAVQVNGSPYEKAGYIHPGMIKNSKGALKGGYQIRVSGNMVDSEGYSIGSGTFSAAGACGLHFSFPLSIKVYKLETVEESDPEPVPEVPETPGNPEDPNETIGGGAGPEPEEEPAKPSVTGLTASLYAPKTTYVGHPAVVSDNSVYQLDGESYGAGRAIELGLGKNSFSLVQSGVGSIHKTTTTKATATFTKPGNYTVKLTETASSGDKSSDTKTIQVLKTPYIIASLGGSQKENRKQLLQISVAQNPDKPVNSLKIVIKDAETGESIAVSKAFGGAESAPVNSANIKYRAPEDSGSDNYFLNLDLPFLTKWHKTKTLQYEITASDADGNTDTKTGSFTVAPDQAPQAAIALEDSYYRGKESKKAEIEVSDVSKSDGDDLERTWYVMTDGDYKPMAGWDGFADRSFGKKQTVSFLKTGVGQFSVKLVVKDKWVEETLPEYISAADYLSAEASAASKVDNVAPIVSLDLLKSETASVFILAEDEKALAQLKTKLSGIKGALIAKGIDADIRTDYRQPFGQPGEISELVTGGVGGRSFRGGELTMHNNYWTGMWQGGNGFSDGHNAYVLTGTYALSPASTSYSVEDYPYTITSYNSDGSVKWKVPVTKSILSSSDYMAGAAWGRTFGGEYIYLVENNQTALFDASSGSYSGTLACELGSLSWLADEYLYTFKSDGIYSMPRGGGALTRIYTGSLSCTEYINGNIRFGTKKAVGSGLGLARGVFDVKTGTVSTYILDGTCGQAWVPGASFIGQDSTGCLFASSGGKVYCFDGEGRFIKEIPLKLYNTGTFAAAFPVISADGRIEFIAETGRSKSGTSSKGYKYHVHCAVHGVYTDDEYSDERTSGSDYPNYGTPVIYALRDGSGAIGIYLGGAYIFNSYDRYLNSVLFSFGGSFSHKFGFPMEKGRQGSRYVTAAANLGGHDDIKQILYVAEGREAETERLKKRNLDSSADYIYYAEYKLGDDVQSIVDGVTNAKESGISSFIVSEASAGAKLSAETLLAPDTTWYYEYDANSKTDIFDVNCGVNKDFAASEGYVVEKEYAEDFDDSDYSSYFTLDTGAVTGYRYRIGYLATTKRDSNALQTGSTRPVSFTVPSGKQAVLSFDYDYLSESGGCSSVYINIARDGVAAPWEKICSDTTWNTGSGTYVHPQILGPGTYTISSVVRDYTSSSKHTNYFYIDNLRVCHVKAGAPVSADLAPAKSSRVSELSGGMYHVSGSFVTPPKTLSFGRYDCEYASGVNNSYANYSDVLSGYSKTVTETISIPSGRKALYSAFTFTGKGARYSSRDYNVFWTLDGAYAGAYYPSPSGSDYLYVVPSPYKSVARGLTGSHVYKATANTRYGTAAGAAGLELYISKAGTAIPESINAGKFIVNSGKLYGLSSEYSGAAKLAFSPAEGTVIRNFKLYTISGGRKVYAEEFFFKDEADAQRWAASGCKAAIGANRTEKEEPARVYAKGETVNYQVFYSDYEADPSKAQFWQYEHEPMNDGLHPKAGQILSASIPKFYVDGKYTVTHWQQDNTGMPAFDKDSNKVSITFYIQGGAQSAPWVKYIKTDPAKVDGGDKYTIAAAVDDEEKDTLSVKIEVYKDGAAKPFATKSFTSLNADASGNYPVLKLTDLPNAQPGTYDVIVTVKDESATGMDSYRFKVKEVKSVTGAVAHTPEWETNRLEWNKVKKGTSAERPANMFWPGEALVLSSKTGGKPSYVTAKLVEFPQFSVRLTRKSENADGTENYEGQLWNAGMLAAIGTTKAVPATVRFTAVYPDGSSLNCDVKIVFDQTQGSYYQLHRRY